MKVLISIYFFILAIIQMGLFFGIYHYYRSQNLLKPSLYWMSSLIVSVVGLFIFGAGVITIKNIANPEFNFTVANSFFYIAALLQALFCQSLNREVSRQAKLFASASVLIFIPTFEYMRLYGTFEIRTLVMAGIASIFYCWQIYELAIKRKTSPSKQLFYMQCASFAEMFFAIGRFVILVASALSIEHVEQIPQILILFTISQLVMNTLSYIAIGSYWAEQIAKENVQSTHENQEIKSLLKERDILIGSLLKANKTASTGALSASIAHELNQPLGASSLNIQFLQKKLAEGELNPTLQKEVLDSLLTDNQRAANIIRSLKSVFAEEKLASAKVDLAQLIDLVLTIARPEIIKQNIQMVMKLEDHLYITANKGELQQVLLNLVNNAIEALKVVNKSDKKITVRGQRTDMGIQISIADNGSGIAPEIQHHMFELLSTTKGSGMGIGLWLCKHIVMRHGGSIWFESSPDKGTTFFIGLPLVAAYAI
ncbi:HAMP domain-containing histidine kinase [Polynucleobacter sp. Ross1-W9]|uniref:sensor histidine kinase n=1 Tax=Polynucleobacter parvulilacunae TaxID=1855631 RepID=UPI001C0C5DDA|nr:HAMP domain-containing sensor histidine kinase [Polynucleobacter parvulilacunae]MBU3558014.1 HAMP domain-containing histidine kinase [Polynucleobacter parvulilacunae]